MEGCPRKYDDPTSNFFFFFSSSTILSRVLVLLFSFCIPIQLTLSHFLFLFQLICFVVGWRKVFIHFQIQIHVHKYINDGLWGIHFRIFKIHKNVFISQLTLHENALAPPSEICNGNT